MFVSRFDLFPIFFLIIFFSLPCPGQIDSSHTRVTFLGIPDSVIVSANDKVITHDKEGWYKVPVGDVRIEIKKSNSLVFSTTMDFREGKDCRIIIECSLGCAQLQINSKPSGAKLSIDGEHYGFTPYTSKYLRPGKNRTIELSMQDYAPLKRSFSISRDKSQVLNFQLSKTMTWKDSVNQIALGKKRTRQKLQKALFGVLSATTAGAGIYCEVSAREQASAASLEADAYDAAVVEEDATFHRNAYESNRLNVNKIIKYRNILMSVAGACFLGFSFSFVF